MKSKRTREFRALFDTLPNAVKRQAEKAYLQFRNDPDYAGLNFMPVGGNPVRYSVRIGASYRALCIRGEDDSYIWIWIGIHADYDKLLKQR